jgi:hypothetical protein
MPSLWTVGTADSEMWPRNIQALLHFKLQIIQYAVEHGKCAAGTYFGVDDANMR